VRAGAFDRLVSLPKAGAPAKDQRGFDRVGDADIGAFEVQGFLTVVSGSGQSEVVNQPFHDAPVVKVTDPLGTPKSGVSVTFAAPGTGASATLTGAPATTDGDGHASVTARAGTAAGSYTVDASVSGVDTPARFTLTNHAYRAVARFDQTQPVKSGATLPIKIQLTDGTGQNVGTSSLRVTADSVTGPGGVLQSPGNSQPGNLFQFDPATKTYQFNLKTEGYKPGRYTFYFKVDNDPTLYSVNFVIG
jgi:adhesin/invasin